MSTKEHLVRSREAKRKRNGAKFIKFKEPITKILVIETVVEENYKADFFIFSEKWKLGHSRTRNLNFSLCLSLLLYHPCRKQSV